MCAQTQIGKNSLKNSLMSNYLEEVAGTGAGQG
jgi:hypothetical protein